jgi:hypothetical protein
MVSVTGTADATPQAVTSADARTIFRAVFNMAFPLCMSEAGCGLIRDWVRQNSAGPGFGL